MRLSTGRCDNGVAGHEFPLGRTERNRSRMLLIIRSGGFARVSPRSWTVTVRQPRSQSHPDAPDLDHGRDQIDHSHDCERDTVRVRRKPMPLDRSSLRPRLA
jgi:hypothetical protein